MVQITLKGNPIHIFGPLPAKLKVAPDFKLVNKELKTISLADFEGKKKVISTVPSLDTGLCSATTKQLNDLAKKHPTAVFITVSADLPFAQNRFCSTEAVADVITLSMMRDKEFGKDYGLLIIDGPLAGILARSVLILDEVNTLIYAELVSEIGQEPDFPSLINFCKEIL